MATDDQPPAEGSDRGIPADESNQRSVRSRFDDGAERAASQFDERIVELLAWLLDTDTRARIYVYLRQHPRSTSEEVARGTGLYPSTVREALAALHEEETVERRKRANGDAGNNPYEYTAMAPSDLVSTVVEDVQRELNTVFHLDHHLGVGSGGAGRDDVSDSSADNSDGPIEADSPVRIVVRGEDDN